MLTTIGKRLTSSLLLTPGLVLLLIWIGRFGGADEIVRLGVWQFLLWAAVVGFGIAATITLYIAHINKSADKK